MNSRKENKNKLISVYSNVHIASNVDIYIGASGDWAHTTFQALANQQKGKEDIDQAIEAIDEAIEKKKDAKDDSKKEWVIRVWIDLRRDPWWQKGPKSYSSKRGQPLHCWSKSRYGWSDPCN